MRRLKSIRSRIFCLFKVYLSLLVNAQAFLLIEVDFISTPNANSCKTIQESNILDYRITKYMHFPCRYQDVES